MATSSMPGTERTMATRRSTPRRASGSPPVMRTFVTPSLAQAATTTAISSRPMTSEWQTFSTPAAGMQ